MNQATVPQLGTEEVIDACASMGYGSVGLWRGRVAEVGPERAARRAAQAGVTVSSLCRGGWFCAPDEAGRRARRDDNRRAVDEAAALGTPVLVLVCGPAAGRDLRAGRREVLEAVQDLAAYASGSGVQLAIEPMHPLYCADRSIVVTLAQARRLAEAVPIEGVGLMVDTYHVWWDPDLEQELQSSSGRILGLQLADWVAPLPDHLNGRAMLGDGAIDMRHIRSLVDEAGYDGPIEVEIFNPKVWELPPLDVFSMVAERFDREVA